MPELFHQRFEVVRPLGEGGMGVVVEAIDRATRSPCAVKLLRPHDLANPTAVERFKREAHATAALRHPHIVGQIAFIEAPPPLLALELLRGEPLRAAMRRGPLPEPLVVVVAQQLLSALGAAHRLGIVHRDLKPTNVFLMSTPDGRPWVKLLDFGIAKLVEYEGPALTRASQVVGTAAYMSPEQVKGGSIDGRSDLYTLGLLLYEMLTGQRAFESSSVHESMLKIMQGAALPPHSRIRPAMRHLLRTVTALDPAARFANAEAMAHALATLAPEASPRDATGTSFGAPPPSMLPTGTLTRPTGYAAPPPRRVWPWVLGALVALVGVAAAAVGITLQLTSAPAPAASGSAPAAPAAATSAAPAAAAPSSAATSASPVHAGGKGTAPAPPAPVGGLGKVGATCTKSGDCAGEGTCNGGLCACSERGNVCGGICRGTRDPEGCGRGCLRCAATERCMQLAADFACTACVTDKRGGYCGTPHQCEDFLTSPNHCGGCNRPCSGTCVDGQCLTVPKVGGACTTTWQCSATSSSCVDGKCACVGTSPYLCGKSCQTTPCQ